MRGATSGWKFKEPTGFLKNRLHMFSLCHKTGDVPDKGYCFSLGAKRRHEGMEQGPT